MYVRALFSRLKQEEAELLEGCVIFNLLRSKSTHGVLEERRQPGGSISVSIMSFPPGSVPVNMTD